MFFRSERLFLRPYWPEDAEELHALIAESGGAIAGSWALGWIVPAGNSVLPHFLITLPGANGSTLVGWIGLRRVSGELTIACWIGAPYRGRGYAREAAEAVRGLARTLGYRDLEGDEPGRRAA